MAQWAILAKEPDCSGGRGELRGEYQGHKNQKEKMCIKGSYEVEKGMG